MDRSVAINKIIEERLRQEALKVSGKFESTCADPIHPHFKFVILSEEVGEVARNLCEANNPEEELIQVAAVVLAWLEAL